MANQIDFYKRLHSNQNFGTSGINLVDEVSLMIDFLKPKIVLDYGCGKNLLCLELSKRYPKIKFYGYDPAIEQYQQLPVDKADFVINSDVLEHIPECEIENVVSDISKISQCVFFNLHHALADAVLDNGENAHCTVKPQLWYYGLLLKYFKNLTILNGREHYTSVILTAPLKWDIIDRYYSIISTPKSLNKNLSNTAKINCKRFFEFVFSVKNEYRNNKKRKVITILGLKIKC